MSTGIAVDGVGAVVLDVGETLVDETHGWGTWADWFGIPRLTFSADLREAGFVVGIAGNQPEGAAEALRSAGVVADFICSSHDRGVETRSSAFFDRVAVTAGVPAGRIAYVGDRIDDDQLVTAVRGL